MEMAIIRTRKFQECICEVVYRKLQIYLMNRIQARNYIYTELTADICHPDARSVLKRINNLLIIQLYIYIARFEKNKYYYYVTAPRYLMRVI